MKKTLSGCAFTLQQLENSYGRDRRAYRLRFAKNNQERGGLSEIGGQMNETEEESVVVVEPQGKKTEEPDPARNGAQSFRNEACEILQLEGREIVKALAAEAKKGHIQCAKFLYDLADENCKLGAAEMIRRVRSLALQWTTEPLWTGEVDDEKAETAGGSGEPKG